MKGWIVVGVECLNVEIETNKNFCFTHAEFRPRDHQFKRLALYH